jgi:hypothetical protein
MSLFSGPEEHAANPPETWEVRKLGDRAWSLTTAHAVILETFPTKKLAEAARVDSFYVTLYGKYTRWYAGENVHPWKPWATVKAEQERLEAWKASRSVKP